MRTHDTTVRDHISKSPSVCICQLHQWLHVKLNLAMEKEKFVTLFVALLGSYNHIDFVNRNFNMQTV